MAKYKLYSDKFIPFNWDKHILRAFFLANCRCINYNLFLPNKNWSEEIITRDKFHCTNCNSTTNLQAHHIFPAKWFPFLQYLNNNGITLCKTCHLKAERKTPSIITFDEFDILIKNVNLIHKRITIPDFWDYHIPNGNLGFSTNHPCRSMTDNQLTPLLELTKSYL